MRGLRAVSAGGAGLFAVLLLATAAPVGASAAHPRAGQGGRARAAGAAAMTPQAVLAGLAGTGAARAGRAVIMSRLAQTGPPRPTRPAAAMLNDRLSGDSCTALGSGSAATVSCMAVGFFQDSSKLQPLATSWQEGRAWAGAGPVPVAATRNNASLPVEVSCAAPGKVRPTCVMVGEHYRNSSFPLQLAEVWTGKWTILTAANPPGTSWSSLEDVSCRTDTFCMMTGEAGTTRQTQHRTVFISHATAYTWNGTTITRLPVPSLPGGRDAELAGVSCPTTTTCLAVGNYLRADGKSQAYSARWSGGTWKVQNARNVTNQQLTLMESVSCVSTTRCEAVGATVTPSTRSFAESWVNGAWRIQPGAGKPNATLIGVSCPSAGHCVAAGTLGTSSLIEAWNGSGWSVQATPGTAAPRGGTALNHVSCVTANACEAVGYRFSRSQSGVTPHTLALGWDGQHWKVQPTVNQ